MSDSKETDVLESEKPRKYTGIRLEDRVHSMLHEAIQNGTYVLGAKLPSENILAEQYSVSRPIIRSALSRLRDEGLVIPKRGSGSFVSSEHEADMMSYEALENVQDIKSYFQFRTFIEAENAALAAEHATPADIESLLSLIDDARDEYLRTSLKLEADILFHNKIAKLSNNRFHMETIQFLRPQMLFVGKFLNSLGKPTYRRNKRPMLEEHRLIVSAIADGDSVGSAKAMTAHLQASLRHVFGDMK